MFEQGRYKRDFLLINLKSRQNVKNVIKKNLFKLMNNANFGPIIDELNGISYTEKYQSAFDIKYSGFVNSNLLEQEIEQTFQQHITEV